MKIVVVGGTGLIGSKLVARLAEQGHQAVAASPGLGVNALTGEGLGAALDGASVVVDVSNARTYEYREVLEFFEGSARNLLAAGKAAGVGHHVVLSIVGTQELAELGDPAKTTAGYFRAKLSQERLVQASSIPYSIVRATQFFEFITGIADGATVGATVRVPPVAFQPAAADDVAAALARVAVGAPLNGVVEFGGPERFRFDEPIRAVLAASGDPRDVVVDPSAGYFGVAVRERSLVPGDGATLGTTHLQDWLGPVAAR